MVNGEENEKYLYRKDDALQPDGHNGKPIHSDENIRNGILLEFAKW